MKWMRQKRRGRWQGQGAREATWMSSTLEGLSWFQHSWNALSDLGSVALTPVSPFTCTLARASVTGKRTMWLWTCTPRVREKVCAGDKSLARPLHPTETPLSRPLCLFLLRGMTAIRHSNQRVFSGNDFTVNRPAQGKPLLTFFSGKGHDALEHFLPCFVRRSTFHLFKEVVSSSARFPSQSHTLLFIICFS